MDPIALHATCGGTFPLAEVVVAGDAGRCPHCGDPVAPGYAAPFVLAARRFVEAVASLELARAQLATLAPGLTVTEGAPPAPVAAGAPPPAGS